MLIGRVMATENMRIPRKSKPIFKDKLFEKKVTVKITTCYRKLWKRKTKRFNRTDHPQCIPGFFNSDQKLRRRNFFLYLLGCKRSWNQSRKTSVIGLPFELLAKQCQPSCPCEQIGWHWLAGNSKGNT